MKKNIFRLIGMAAVLAVVLSLALPVFAASGDQKPAARAVSKEQLKEALRELLREDPDLVMSVLRQNSELVLEIAQHGSIQRNRKSILARWQEELNQKVNLNIRDHAVRGARNAPVTIVGFTDFTCSYCRQSEEVLLQLMEQYKGKIRFVYKPMPKDDELSQLAARYAVAALLQDEEKGWAYYDALFAAGPKLIQGGEAFLRAEALQAGLDVKKLFTEVNSKKVTELMKADKEEAAALDVRGTPYFFVNNLIIRGYVAKDLFEEAIQMALKAAGK